jgi:hypothetical protein
MNLPVGVVDNFGNRVTVKVDNKVNLTLSANPNEEQFIGYLGKRRYVTYRLDSDILDDSIGLLELVVKMFVFEFVECHLENDQIIFAGRTDFLKYGKRIQHDSYPAQLFLPFQYWKVCWEPPEGIEKLEAIKNKMRKQTIIDSQPKQEELF